MTTKITKNKQNQHEIEGKITYVKDTLYKLDFPKGFEPDLKSLKIGKEIEEGEEIKSAKPKAEPKLEEIPYKGEETEMLPGVKINEGDVLYTQKRFLRKKVITSPVDGTIKEITDEQIIVEVKSDEEDEGGKTFKSPFGGKVKRVENGYILLEFPAVQVNLFESKGGSVVGPIRYLSSTEIKKRKNLSSKLEGSVVVTDQITADLYPMLSTLGVGGVIANSVDYALFKNMIMLAVPIGIIAGFGYTPTENSKSEVQPELNEDEHLLKYIDSIEGKTVWFDSDYGRLIIPEPKEPMSLKKHKFKLWQH